ncbi:MAG: DUF1566 domain-containing protein [Pseudobdellovibrionaceae bacterium]
MKLLSLVLPLLALSQSSSAQVPSIFGMNRGAGSSAANGPINVGTYDGGTYYVMPGGCDGTTSDPTCSGTDGAAVQRKWFGSTGSAVDILSLTNIASAATASPQLEKGDFTTAFLVTQPSISSDSAADYCNDMDFGGYTDWYLPSKSELAFIYCKAQVSLHSTWNPQEDPNCVAFGGKTSTLKGFVTGVSSQYWSSSEGYSSNYAYYQSFYDGTQTEVNRMSSLYVRCVRRDGGNVPSEASMAYREAGTYSFTVPTGVTTISALVVGGGGGAGGGRDATGGGTRVGGGAGGGQLYWANGIPVTAGETLTLVVGAGGIGGTGCSASPTAGFAGGNSYVKRGATDLIWAVGGSAGATATAAGAGGTGGTTGAGITYTTRGGGNGGPGGAAGNNGGGGGGGAGGYSGTGGGGGVGSTSASIGAAPTASSGAANGGRSGGSSSTAGTRGGGVGVFGIGATGDGINTGQGGSGGIDGTSGGQHGGGAGGGGICASPANSPAPSGGVGAVRILWGASKSFPSSAGP